MSAVMTHAVC